MRKLSAFIACSLSLLTSMAQLGRYSADLSLSCKDFADTIAIEWVQEQVLVPVVIEGRSYRFLLDTGAGQTVVFSGTPLAKAPQIGTIKTHDATGRTDTVAMVALPPMQLGHVALAGCRATVQRRAVGGGGLDGILGFDLVNSGLSLKIDVPRRQMVLSDRPHLFCRDKNATGLKYTLNFHVPYIDIIPFARVRERVLFDTGSRQFFAMNKARFDRALASRRAKGDDTGLTVEGRSVGRHAIGHLGTETEGEVAFLQLDSLRLGRCVFSGIHSLTTQGGSHLGAPLLRHGSVAFCPRHHTMYFKVEDSQSIAVNNRQTEIAFVAAPDGRAQVGLVWEKGVPYRLGFRQGDVVEQIDHRPVESLAQLARWAFERGRAYVFTLSDSLGRRRDVEWVRIP